jgi:hypothetical protein
MDIEENLMLKNLKKFWIFLTVISGILLILYLFDWFKKGYMDWQSFTGVLGLLMFSVLWLFDASRKWLRFILAITGFVLIIISTILYLNL